MTDSQDSSGRVPSLINLDGYFSIDIEASGPTPGGYSMLSLGACLVTDPAVTFYVELQPTSLDTDPEAMAVHGLDLEIHQRDGLPPAEGIRRFDQWVGSVCPPAAQPVFVAYNAPFDWMFIQDAFIRTLGRNPFGHTALDIRAVYAGWTGRPWGEIRFNELSQRYLHSHRLTHHALEDAVAQAEIFLGLMQEISTGRGASGSRVGARGTEAVVE
jgi:DNA polymerase III epsilon subunit-like protein